MKEIAPDVFHLPVAPRNGVNVYLLGDVLVDTGLRTSAGTIKKQVGSRKVSAIALTHAHGDHCGTARKLSSELGIPVWVGAADREAIESGQVVAKPPYNQLPLSPLANLMGNFPSVKVDRTLAEGDSIGGGFTVLDTPGHSPGHVSFWRESDGVLICGDVFFNMNILTTVPGLREPPGPFTFDPPVNRAAERKVAALSPSVAGFGHGPVITDGTAEKLSSFVAKLPAD